MKTLKIEKFNKLAVGRKVMVYAPNIADKPVKGTIEENRYIVDKYVQLNNGDEIFTFDIEGIWGIDKDGNREEL